MRFRIVTSPSLALLSTSDDGAEVVVPVGVKPTVLLVLLSAAGPQGISRRAVRNLLWEGSSEANASNSLRQSVFQIRRALGADHLRDVNGRLFLGAVVRVDLVDMERRLEAGRLSEALDVLGGPIGSALDVAGSGLKAWILELRTRLERRLLDALVRGWSDAARGPVPGLFAPILIRASQVLGDTPELLWMQLEVATTLRDGGAFDQLARRLDALDSQGGGAAAITDRLRMLRQRMEAGEGGRTIGEPIHPHALQALECAWRGARAGRASVVSIIGAPGTGRSWLLRELGRRCLADGGRTVPLVALASSAGIPSACLRDLTVALEWCRGAAGVLPDFSNTIDRLYEGVLHPPSDAVPAVHDLLTAVAAEGPLLVTLDDAHHYDVRVLARLLRTLRETPVAGLLVVPVLHTSAGLEETPSTGIGHVGPDGIRTLLGAMARLPRAEWVTPLVEALHRSSGGRPGPAAQAVVRLHDAGHLRVTDDRWILASPLWAVLSALTSTAA